MKSQRRSISRTLLVLAVLLAAQAAGARAGESIEPLPGLGFTPIPPGELAHRVRTPPLTASLPTHLDWRDEGIITPAKDQRSCGACWAFAAIGMVEAMAVRAGADPTLDLSEQQVISCDHDPWWIGSSWVSNDGCCSGTLAVFEYLIMNPTVLESDFAFQEGDSAGTRSCSGVVQAIDIVPCPRQSPPEPTEWQVATWDVVSETLVASVEEMKTALQDGPLWVGFYVFPDFRSYWNTGTGTYRRTGNWQPEGGHAVMLIGYDDAGQYWICKNSWGPRNGPFDDGTFRMAYDSNCDFGINAASITVHGETPAESATWGRIRQAFR